jgi:hypothetical protein
MKKHCAKNFPTHRLGDKPFLEEGGMSPILVLVPSPLEIPVKLADLNLKLMKVARLNLTNLKLMNLKLAGTF